MNDAAPAVCIVCSTGLYDDEQQTCQRCIHKVAANLQALAGSPTWEDTKTGRRLTSGYYAALADALHPGSSSGGPAVSGSRTAPVPLKLDVLNLQTERGPIIAPLESWVRDWETHGRATVNEAGTLQQRLDHAVGTLRFNLNWAAANHGAFADFADELHTIKRKIEIAVGTEKQPTRIPLACHCGQILHVSLDMDRIQCRHCGAEYGHREMLHLTPTRRAAA